MARSESRLILGQIGTLDTLVVLSEDLAKFDGQFENAVNKIVDVLRSAFKGDESRLDFTCRIADRIQLIERGGGLTGFRTTGIIHHEFSMYCKHLAVADKRELDQVSCRQINRRLTRHACQSICLHPILWLSDRK